MECRAFSYVNGLHPNDLPRTLAYTARYRFGAEGATEVCLSVYRDSPATVFVKLKPSQHAYNYPLSDNSPRTMNDIRLTRNVADLRERMICRLPKFPLQENGRRREAEDTPGAPTTSEAGFPPVRTDHPHGGP